MSGELEWVKGPDGVGRYAPKPAGGSLPAGGTTGEVLTKASDADGDADWETAAGLVTESAQYSGPNVLIDNGQSGALDWSILDTGDDILDVTNPVLPVVRKAGLFIVDAQCEPASAFTPGGVIEVDLTFDYTGNAPFIHGYAPANPTNGGVSLLMSGSYVLDAGDAIQLLLTNSDGVSARNFVLKNAFVSRIGPA